jgi:cytochrome c
MDSFELNKILGAVLGTLLFVMGVGFLAEGIYHPIEDRGPGYALPEPEGTEAGGPAAPEAVAVSIGTHLSSPDPVQGEQDANKCKICHTQTNGGANGTGPNLWGVVGRPIASHAGFTYSEAMVAHSKEVPNWTYDELNHFLTSPKGRVPNTKMGFAGVKDDAERANIIAYLSTLSDSPVPFPPPEAAAPAEGEAPAEAAPAETAPAEAAPAPEAPSAETNTAPTPAAETPAAPAAETTANEPAETTQSETPVEGTTTNSNTPAGAETTPAAPAVETAPAAPAATPAPAAQ